VEQQSLEASFHNEEVNRTHLKNDNRVAFVILADMREGRRHEDDQQEAVCDTISTSRKGQGIFL
jgi:hypothetical protein